MNASDIVMAFFDFIPVVAYAFAAIILQRVFYNKMSKGCFAVFSAGTITVIVAGLLKAIYKLLYVFHITRFDALSQCFFPMQTVGFFLAGASILALLCFEQGKNTAACIAAPAILTSIVFAYAGNYEDVQPIGKAGTMTFVALMCLGVVVFDGGLAVIAALNKKWIELALFIVALVFTLGMGYLSTKDEMNDWIKEFVNIVGQGSVLAGALLFKKHGMDAQDVRVSFKK